MNKDAARIRTDIVFSMREAGVKQEYVAERLGIRPETFSRKMHGKSFTEEELVEIKQMFHWKSISGREER